MTALADSKPRANIKKMAKLRQFAAAYFAHGFDASRAAALVSTARPHMTPGALARAGSRYLQQARAEGYIEHELGKAAHAMGSAEVIARLSEQARADIGVFVALEPSGAFRFDLAQESAKGKTHLIRKLTHDRETGAPIVELHDAQAALALLAKVHGLFGDAPPQAPVAPQVNVQVILAQLSDGALREVVAALQGGSGRAIETTAIPAPVPVSTTYGDPAPSEAPEPVTPDKP